MKKILSFIRLQVLTAMLLSMLCVLAQAPEYGLHIKSYPEPGSQLTTVLINGDKPIQFNGDDLILSFDLWLRHDNVLGTVVRIISDTGKNVDLLYSIENDNRYPNLVTGDIANLQTTLPTYDEWVPVSILVSPSTGNVQLNYNGVVTTSAYPDLKGSKSVRIIFGFCNIDGFTLADVASANIKDVVVTRGKNVIRFWKFNAHLDDRCLDEIHHQPAIVTHPQWIVDESAKWTKIFDRKFKGLPSVAFDPVIASFYIVAPGSNKLLVFHAPEGVTDTIVTAGLPHLSDSPNQLIFIPRLHKLLSYNIDDDHFAIFDPVKQQWINGGKAVKEHDFWNNSVSYNPTDSSLVSFGGYGHYKFNNLLLTCYPFAGKPQHSMALKQIHPRRSCATTIVNDQLYIFGGWGCPSGRQELDTRNYYDLYKINLADNTIQQLWDLKNSPFGKGFHCLENMIYDQESDAFLMLSTLDNGTLLKVDRKSGKMVKMSYPMDLKIDSHYFYGNFYLSHKQNKYYAAVVCSQTDGVTDLTIYELPAPAFPVDSLMQEYTEPTESESSNEIFLYIGVVVILGCIIWILIYRYLKTRRTPPHANNCKSINTNHATSSATEKDTNTTGLTDTEETPDHAIIDSSNDPDNDKAHINSMDSTIAKDETSELHADDNVTDDANLSNDKNEAEIATRYYDLTHSCVRLFGGFRVLDKNGVDITSSFTPTLKQLLLVLILYTGKNSTGISSNKLLDIIWGDKELMAAKNNRNVYLSRLRPLLQQIGDVTIGSHNGFRNIKFGGDTICDFLEFISLSEKNSPENNNRSLELLLNGMLLPNVESDYVDSFKSDFSNSALDFLTNLLHQDDISLKQRVKIADIIFQHDFINEDALQVKCKALHTLGRTGMAHAVYDSFCKEYMTLMGNPYPHSLSEIIDAK